MGRSPIYGQVVVGPPGSGKTTYCDGMQQYLRLLGRDAWVINLDPANEGILLDKKTDPNAEEGVSGLPYDTLFDVCKEVVNLTSVMERTKLGPNGGLIFCMEYLEEHVDDVISAIEGLLGENMYLIIDLPGQVELYTHNECVQNLLHKMIKAWDLRLTMVQLVDIFYCTDVSKFLSASLLSTTTMLRLEMPTVNVLSKADLLSGYDELPMNLEFFTECNHLDRLLPFLDQSSCDEDIDVAENPVYQKARAKRRQSRFYKKYSRLHESIAEVVQDYALLHFLPLDISSAESVGRVVSRVDKANGYVFVDKGDPADLFKCAIQHDSEYESLASVQERIEPKRGTSKSREARP